MLKRTLLLIFLLAGAAMFALTACQKGEGEDDDPIIDPPIDVPFVKYSLEGTSSQWTNLDLGLPPSPNRDDIMAVERGRLIVIDTAEELTKYIDGDDYPAIDFSKKTLLLAYGMALYSYSGTRDEQFEQVSARGYQMSFEVWTGMLGTASEWQTAIVVDKLPTGSRIELDVTTPFDAKNQIL